ncbi:MAG TPA: C39 family peptidase [Candidatus Sumerlaeota bacterium]|nr:C39 family peptidase [Candidatus Sumerlaeota bacterium]
MSLKAIMILLLSLVFATAAGTLFCNEEAAQSTTGPTPPPGVGEKVKGTAPLTRADKLMTGVPGYAWRHGCGPTAVGMVIGYHDGHGFPNLIPGDAATQTAAVDQAIASEDGPSNPQHYEDYCLPMDNSGSNPSPLPDKSAAPSGDEHISNSIADFMRTSWSSAGNYYGWSWSSDIGPSFAAYNGALGTGYSVAYVNHYFSSPAMWDVLNTEINNNRPMVFLVDTDGDGNTDHFVTVIGYRDSGGYQEYACLDTWAPADVVRWERFRPMASGSPWGIWGGTSFSIAVSSSVREWDLY